jgi:hypothetical protein
MGNKERGQGESYEVLEELFRCVCNLHEGGKFRTDLTPCEQHLSYSEFHLRKGKQMVASLSWMSRLHDKERD